jgi:SAM-dependent methyltransferase
VAEGAGAHISTIPGIDWRWRRTSIVPAYYDRALASIRDLPPAGARLLEVGVGCGYVLSKLALSCRGKGIGLDSDTEAVELSRNVARSFGAQVVCVRGYAQGLPSAAESFDLVFSQGLIEHFAPAESERILAEHVRVLKRGGVLAVSVPNLFNPFHSWLKWREGESYRFHPERSLTPRALARLLEGQGVRVEGRDGYGLLWSLWHQRSRLAYNASALTLRLGFGQEFETRLPPTMRAYACMMTMAWGRRTAR